MFDEIERQVHNKDEELEGFGAMDPETGQLFFMAYHKIDGKVIQTIRHKLNVNDDSYDFTLVLEDRPEITITVKDIVEATIEVSDLICEHYEIDKEFVKNTIRKQWLEPMETLEIIGRT